MRQKVLAAYKEMLQLINRLPEAQRPGALADARLAMRQHQAESNPARQSDLFKQLAAKISFLRAVTPRVPGDASAIGAGQWVFRGGQLVEGSGETASRSANGSMSMEEASQRHRQLLKRQNFGREPPPYNPASF